MRMLLVRAPLGSSASGSLVLLLLGPRVDLGARRRGAVDLLLLLLRSLSS